MLIDDLIVIKWLIIECLFITHVLTSIGSPSGKVNSMHRKTLLQYKDRLFSYIDSRNNDKSYLYHRNPCIETAYGSKRWQSYFVRTGGSTICKCTGILPRSHQAIDISQRTHDAIITSLWCPNYVATPFWRHDNVVVASCGRRDIITIPCQEKQILQASRIASIEMTVDSLPP